MSSLAPHPARSPDFLSRLHDGDLTAAERAQFESHRAHCAECRRAAADFESALALFRSSHPRPPASDLSARILRKLQAGNSRRRPFGVTFGIDLRWAGAFAAALLAVLIGSAVVVRRESAERRVAREEAPIPVVMERERRADEPAKNEFPPSERKPPSGRRVAETAPKSQSEERDGVVPGFAESPGTRESAAAPPAVTLKGSLLDKENKARQEAENRAPADRVQQAKSQAAAATEKSDPAASSASRAQERLGGEAAQYQSTKDAGEAGALRLRLEILPMDGGGTPPAIVAGTDNALPTDLRGREFTLIVEAGGRVREVRAAEGKLRKKSLAKEESSRDQLAVSDEKAPQALKDLRFEPGTRARILRVRIE